VTGLTVCRSHGGAAPGAKAAAAVRVADAKARQLLGHLVADPVDDPLSALRTIAGKSLAWATLLEGKVAELSSLRYSTDGGEQIRGEIQLLVQALTLCYKINTDLARIGLDERLVRVTERQAEQLTDVIAAILADLHLTAEQSREAASSVPRHLRAITAA
jgi:hypothetical protein